MSTFFDLKNDAVCAKVVACKSRSEKIRKVKKTLCMKNGEDLLYTFVKVSKKIAIAKDNPQQG
jgi:hypothetical protein